MLAPIKVNTYSALNTDIYSIHSSYFLLALQKLNGGLFLRRTLQRSAHYSAEQQQIFKNNLLVFQQKISIKP